MKVVYIICTAQTKLTIEFNSIKLHWKHAFLNWLIYILQQRSLVNLYLIQHELGYQKQQYFLSVWPNQQYI